MKRHSDALAIQAGACNIAAMARSLVKACDEVQSEHGMLAHDAAVKLIVHQIAYIAGIISGVEDFYAGSYSECADACKNEVIAQSVVNGLQGRFVV